MSQGNPLSPSPVPRTDVFAEALRRARTADAAVTRPARRTFAAMAPGSVRQPVLQLAPNVHFLPTAANNERCLFCDRWLCDGSCGGFAPVPAGAALKVAA
ncbi:hypothetical protein [Streptomyces zaomyceticus]|uniref:hypothetical protein n=1 Tax=Streptomyces zaomyceticus TaxID=68286 RepID=UPI0033A230A1